MASLPPTPLPLPRVFVVHSAGRADSVRKELVLGPRSLPPTTPFSGIADRNADGSRGIASIAGKSLLLGTALFLWIALPLRLSEMHYTVIVLDIVHTILAVFATALIYRAFGCGKFISSTSSVETCSETGHPSKENKKEG